MSIELDASELILSNSKQLICETYIFEPSVTEKNLGRLFAVAEVSNEDGQGAEILDMVVTAVQREYYRSPTRGVLASFESALHQANLSLHDLSARGNREWANHFHVAVGVLAGSVLHISVAGDAIVLLHRGTHTANISYGLAQTPITNPLRTFSQVASGTVTGEDALFFGTSELDRVFPETDLKLVAHEPSAVGVTSGLQQFYRERNHQEELAVLAIKVIADEARLEAQPDTREGLIQESTRPALSANPKVAAPRKPIMIRRSGSRQLLALLWQVLRWLGLFVGKTVWPFLRKLFGAVGLRVAKQAKQWKKPKGENDLGESASVMASLKDLRQPVKEWRSWPSRVFGGFREWMGLLPITSKIFVGLTLVLAVALMVSLLFLQQKREEDSSIQRASELLHDGQTKQQAAATALIYNNREQAQTLLTEAEQLANEVAATGLYQDEVEELKSSIQDQYDRVQRIARVGGTETEVVGDFKERLGDATAANLFFVNDNLYTFDPTTNAIFQMSTEGSVTTLTSTTQGIGFFEMGVQHDADKQLIFLTSEPGVALVDTKEASVNTQEITLPATDAKIKAIAPYGSRLYAYDETTHNIYAYSKTLRGYAGQQSWVKNTGDLPRGIVSMAIDGSVYTLHSEGTIKEFFKGDLVADFEVEEIGPTLAHAEKIFTSEDHINLYVLDTSENRVVIFNKKGELQRQVFLDSQDNLRDMAVSSNEETLYLLMGTQVLKVNLVE